MSAQIVEPANLINLAGRGLNAEEIVADEELSKSLSKEIALLVAAIVEIN